LSALFESLSVRCHEFLTIEEPRTLEKRMLGLQLARLYSEPESSGAHMQKLRRLGEIHPVFCLIIRWSVAWNVVMTP
jgi:hypothetical protein